MQMSGSKTSLSVEIQRCRKARIGVVHGALETLTHTTQQVTTHSSEPHPQASGVVPSSHTMRWLLAVSCLSLSRAVPIPTSPITLAPETPAPPTVVPRAACEALLSPPLVATIRAPVYAAEYVECWTFQCVGTVEVTFSNLSTRDYRAGVMLQNSDGYVLTSLFENRERYIATYPANGEMTVLFNDSQGYSYYYENEFTFEWECNTGPAVVPAAGFDASTNLTLPPAGTYERMYSEQAIYSWLIPCTGMLDIAATSSSSRRYVEFGYMNSDGTILASHWDRTTFNGIFSVAGNFNITLRSRYQGSSDSRFAFAWSCGGTRPDLPSPDPTPAPETPAPPTVVPRTACEALLSPPLVATIRAPVYRAEYVECWTFQCVGTVEVTFSNLSTRDYRAGVMLQNSDGYVLTSLVDNRERYIATYPANGEMTVVFNDSQGYSYYYENEFTFEWECNTGPAVVPAAGFDASTNLTLPPAGTYERMFSEQAIYSWLIPCTGMLDIAATSSSSRRYVEFGYMNSDGTILASHWDRTTFNGIFTVAGNFNITLRSRYQGSSDSKFAFAWSCGGTRPDFPSPDPTPAPETPAPPTVVPRAPCEALLSPPLVATIRAPVYAAEYVECWTFQCVGTVEVTFSNLSTRDYRAGVMLQNSDGYVLTSLVDNRERYIATYPANGEMTVLFNDSQGYSYYYENEFTFEWECNTGPAVVPAAGFDASTNLTLPPAGTYERMFSEQAIYSWLIPCTGMLDIAATSSSSRRYVEFGYMNSDGTILASHWDRTTFNGIFSVAGNFNITLRSRYQGSSDSRFAFAWSCGGATAAPSVSRAPHTDAPPTVSWTPAPTSHSPSTSWTSIPTGAPTSRSPVLTPGATRAPDTHSPITTPAPPGMTVVPITNVPGLPTSHSPSTSWTSIPTDAPTSRSPVLTPGATLAPATPHPWVSGTPTPPAATPEPLPKPQQCGVDTVPRRCGRASRDCEWQVQHPGRLLSVGFSADGGRVATGAWDGAVRVFDVATGVQLVQMGCADFRVYDIAYSPDGTSVALGGEGGRVVVCDAATGVLTRELVNLNGSGSVPVRRVVWSGDGRYVVSGGGGDVRTRVFEVAGWAPSAVLQRHARDVAFSVDGSHLATVWGTEVDEVVTVWGLEDATSAAELRSVGGRVTALSFHDGELLRGLDNGVVSVTGWAGGFGGPSYERLSLQTRSGVVFDSSFSPDGTVIASVGEGDVTVWSSSDGAVLKDLVGHSRAVPRLAFSPDGARLATVGHEGALIMWTL